MSSGLRLLLSFSWPVFPGLDQALFAYGFPVFWDSIPKRCKGVHCVDPGESFPTSIYLQKLASIQPRTSPVKFARSPRTFRAVCFPFETQSGLLLLFWLKGLQP